MSAAEQLTTARADLVSLEADTATLEANVAAQSADLDRLRREARAGRAEFADVVAQQTRRDAAAGILAQHLEDVASARALVEELEGAAAEAVAVAEVRAAWEVIETSGHEYAELAHQLEGQIKAGLDRLAELRTAQQAAQQTVSRQMVEAAARGAGLSVGQVRDMLTGARGNPTGEESRRRAALIARALEEFAEVAEADHAAELVEVARDVAGAGVYGPGAYKRNLSPDGCPLVSQAQQVHRWPL